MVKENDHLSPHPRYSLIERLGQGGMGEVFCARDRLTDQLVALKRIIRFPQAESPEPQRGDQLPGYEATSLPLDALFPESLARGMTATAPRSSFHNVLTPHRAPDPLEAPPNSYAQVLRLHLAQEFRTLAGLRHPHIVSVIDYGFDLNHQPYFTMELLQRAMQLDAAARGQPFPLQVGLLVQVLQALAYLHRYGVLHRDLKPGNVLATQGPSGPQVKLLDFGLAVLKHGAEFQRAEIAGTMGYMAPEILDGEPASEASDLFAVGVMAHELLVDQYGLGSQATAARLEEHSALLPLSSDNAKLGSALCAVLHRAVARCPDERYCDAGEFAYELCSAVDLPPPPETIEIRESFLQAAPFVARESERGTLRQALEDAEAGHGAVFLVGGESGVGKSRLLDELRTLALVRGTQVARGQAIRTGGAAYQVWQGVLRPLCLDSPLDALAAGVLQTMVPDIAMLLGHPVQKPQALGAQEVQTRLLFAVERLICSRRAPLLVILEDLHWADPTSFALLLHLVRSHAFLHSPVLVVGSYRNDERPDLLQEVPGARSLQLQRLRPAEMEALSASMLGEVGKRKDVMALLSRETEGNAFFIVEVIRALAEEAGALKRIGSGRIPSQLAASSVQEVLARRLGRIPKNTRPLLCAAAVLGRELDLRVLRAAMPAELSAQLEADLATCAEAAVLEVNENRWRFSHDKLREAMLHELAPEALAKWHLQIGQAIEKAYAADVFQHAAALGHHFEQAGEYAQAVPYMVQAGARALHGGAVQEAIAHLEPAVALFHHASSSPAEQAQALGLLCRAYIGAGRPEETAQVLERMFAEAGMPTPQSSLATYLDIARLGLRHVAVRLGLQAESTRRQSAADAWVGEVADAFEVAGPAFVVARTPLQVGRGMLAWVALAEQLGDPARMAPAYNGLGVMFSATPFDGLADGYFQRSRQLGAKVPNLPHAVRVRQKAAEAFVYTGRGKWTEALAILGDEIEDTQVTGNYGVELFALRQRSCAALCRGDSAALLVLLAQMDKLARRIDSAEYLCCVLCIQGLLALRAGEFEQASAWLGSASEHEARARDRVSSALWGSQSALCALRRGDAAQARRHADKTLIDLGSAPLMGINTPEMASSLVETYFTLWATNLGNGQEAELHLLLRQSLAELRKIGLTFQVCRSQAFLWHGRYAAIRGHHRLGELLARKALRAAEHCQTQFDQGVAHQALAELAAARGQLARMNEEQHQARALFERIGARWYLLQVRPTKG